MRKLRQELKKVQELNKQSEEEVRRNYCGLSEHKLRTISEVIQIFPRRRSTHRQRLFSVPLSVRINVQQPF